MHCQDTCPFNTYCGDIILQLLYKVCEGKTGRSVLSGRGSRDRAGSHTGSPSDPTRMTCIIWKNKKYMLSTLIDIYIPVQTFLFSKGWWIFTMSSISSPLRPVAKSELRTPGNCEVMYPYTYEYI